VFSLTLYFSAQHFLVDPVKNDVEGHARMLASHANSNTSACFQQSPFGGPPSALLQGQSFDQGQGQNQPIMDMIACFDQNGTLLQESSYSQPPSAFLTNTLAITALKTGATGDTINGGSGYGQIYRYAVVIYDPSGNRIIGVVMVGESIQDQVGAVSLLLTLLLSVGGVTLLGAGLGGLFLANRALAPARLAWTNQQRFIADAAHELRTPLTLLRADAEVLLRSHMQMDEEDTLLLEDIVEETNHMSNLASNLLTLARLDNNTSHREHEVVNLVDIARAGLRRVQALADQTGITVQLAADEPVLVIGDRSLLEQAVLALLDNAIKYNRPDGQITIRTSIKQEQALLEVRDTGIGIAAEYLPHLGERFYRVDKARSRQAGGTGLGLSIARSIANVHGGTLTLTSIPEQGTTVILLLPLARETHPDDEEDIPGSVSSLPEKM
jgi:signal transduction histidine kinase